MGILTKESAGNQSMLCEDLDRGSYKNMEFVLFIFLICPFVCIGTESLSYMYVSVASDHRVNLQIQVSAFRVQIIGYGVLSLISIVYFHYDQQI